MEYFDEVGFTIVGEQAYTEDNILIKNLVFTIGPTMRIPSTYEKILAYFQEFGHVVKIKYFGEARVYFAENEVFYLGTVHFAEYKAAARVLQKRNHFVGPLTFYKVFPSYSWTQPDGKNMMSFLENVTTCYSEPDFTSSYCLNRTSLLGLNEDCLRYIYNYLTLKDQINLALTCQYLFNLFRKKSIYKYKHLETVTLNSLTLWQKLLFFKTVGTFVETLDVKYLNEKISIKCLGPSCINVKTLDVGNGTYRLTDLVRYMKFLSTLTLNNVNVGDGSIWTTTQSCPNLKSLKLINMCKLSGKHIIKFCVLEELHIENCTYIRERHCIEIFRVLKTLRHLTIIASGFLNETYCKAITKNLLKLETLRLWINLGHFKGIAKLPNLKKLEIGHCNKKDNLQQHIGMQFFEDLYKYKRNKLEELKIYNSNWIDLKKASLLSALKKLKVLICPNNNELYDVTLMKLSDLTELEVLNVSGSNLTNDGVLYLIERCTKLKLLELFDIPALTGTLFTNMISILKNQHTALKRCHYLEVKVDENKFAGVLFNSPELMEMRYILKISFNSDAPIETVYMYSEDEEDDFEDYSSD